MCIQWLFILPHCTRCAARPVVVYGYCKEALGSSVNLGKSPLFPSTFPCFRIHLPYSCSLPNGTARRETFPKFRFLEQFCAISKANLCEIPCSSIPQPQPPSSLQADTGCAPCSFFSTVQTPPPGAGRMQPIKPVKPPHHSAM